MRDSGKENIAPSKWAFSEGSEKGLGMANFLAWTEVSWWFFVCLHLAETGW
jgi:hypothetical protein